MLDLTQAVYTGLFNGLLLGFQIFFHAVTSSPVMIILIALIILRKLTYKRLH